MNTWSTLRNMWGGSGWDLTTFSALEHMVDATQQRPAESNSPKARQTVNAEKQTKQANAAVRLEI